MEKDCSEIKIDDSDESIVANVVEYLLDYVVAEEVTNVIDAKMSDKYVCTKVSVSMPGTSGDEGLSKGNYTVKEILTEILDSPIIWKPTYQKRNKEYIDASSESEILEDSIGKLQYSTVKDILNEVLDSTMYVKAPERSIIINDQQEPCTSSSPLETQSEFVCDQTNLPLYKFLDTTANPSNGPHSDEDWKCSTLLPSYSTVIKLGPTLPVTLSTESSLSFIPKIPPPSYAEVNEIWEELPSLISNDSLILGPNPVYAVCPRCRTVTVTQIWRERSKLTHLIALILCLCMCWPCCLLPYCLGSFNYTYHRCSNCRYYLGEYRPF